MNWQLYINWWIIVLLAIGCFIAVFHIIMIIVTHRNKYNCPNCGKSIDADQQHCESCGWFNTWGE